MWDQQDHVGPTAGLLARRREGAAERPGGEADGREGEDEGVPYYFLCAVGYVFCTLLACGPTAYMLLFNLIMFFHILLVFF